MPWIARKDGDKVCVYRKGADGQPAGDALHCYSGDDAQTKANDYLKALYANSDHANMSELEGESLDQKVNTVRDAFYKTFQSNFVELSAKDIKMIDGLAAGTYTAKSGDEVTFNAEDLETFVENTMAVIESSTTEKGEVVGLPIDMDAHDHKGGAGWIVGAELDKARNVIRLAVKWTKEGTDLISGNIRRFFSPSADPVSKTIFGGSLTNWPATREENGKFVLRPVELSQYMKEIDMPKTLEELQAELDAANTALETKTAEAAELSVKLQEVTPPSDVDETVELHKWMESDGEHVEELSKRAQQQAELIVKMERRKDKVVEFASMVTGGTKEKPFGLPIRQSRLIKFLLKLPEELSQEAMDIIGLTWKKSIDFAEHGIDGKDYSLKPKLPEEFAGPLKLWIEAKKDARDWFAEMSESGVGKFEDWNLTGILPVKE